MSGLFSSLGFASPLVLLGLIGLPLIWLIARAIPPAPKPLIFPPARLLGQLPRTDESTSTAPWWLKLLRIAAIGLAILALAGPRLAPQSKVASGPLTIVIDNGWTSAQGWAGRIREASRAAAGAEGIVRLVFTAPDRTAPDPRAVLTGAQAAAVLQAASPTPLTPNHERAAAALARISGQDRVLWWSDGLSWPGTAVLKAAVDRAGDARVRLPEMTATAITGVQLGREGARVTLQSVAGAPARPVLQARDARGRVLASVTAPSARGTYLIPLDEGQSREIAEVRVRGFAGAGSVRLLDAWDRRVRVGIVAPRADDQPLLSDAYYLEAALRPFADINRAETARLVEAGFNAILLPDTGRLLDAEARALSGFVEAGGVLVRFAGPRFAESGGVQLSPVPVNKTPRVLSGALAWQQSGVVAPFKSGTPFAGLNVPADARIRTIAVPATEGRGAGAAAVWAELEDGTPLVSASQQGKGWIVLFHTTAGPGWSDVAFSGLQIGMLRRAIAQATTSALPASQISATVPLKPVLLVDGAGRLRPPNSDDRTLAPQEAANPKADVWRWPGVYQGGGARVVLQPAPAGLVLAPLGRLPAGVRPLADAPDGPIELAGPLLAGALGLLMAELAATLALTGMIGGGTWRSFELPARLMPGRSAVAQMLVIGFALALASAPGVSSRAQDGLQVPEGLQLPEGFELPSNVRPPREPSQTPATQTAENAGPETILANPQLVHLAWLRTGDAANDRRSREGMQGLALTLAERTSVIPGEVVGMSPTDGELALVPILYWRIAPNAAALPQEAVAGLNTFMRNGGLLIIDTGATGSGSSDARALAEGPLRGLSLPPLQRIPAQHVLTKSFYLLQNFPGRYADAILWTESAASSATNANDGVSPVLIGNGDWASAWARTSQGAPLASIDGEERQRELANRVGINIVLYALTGNYKADQVHIPALLERLGQESLGQAQPGFEPGSDAQAPQ
jgi:hypothetical protein